MSIKKYIATQQIIDGNRNTPKEERAPTYLYRHHSRRVDDEPKSQRGNTARQERPRERENKLSRTTKLRPLKSQQ
jgi:hypothetical protein